MDCTDVLRELAALIYGETDEETTREARAHLARCSTCRKEWEETRAVTRLLDTWEGPEAAGDPNAPFRPVPSRLRRRPLLLSSVAGIAAAAAIFFALGWIGVRIERTSGGVRVTFGRVASSEERAPASPSREELRAVVREEMRGGLDEVYRAVLRDVLELAREEDARRIDLVRAVHIQRAEDLRRTEAMFHEVALGSAAESERNRRLIEGLATLVLPDASEEEDKSAE